jgi:hypothetical protein
MKKIVGEQSGSPKVRKVRKKKLNWKRKVFSLVGSLNDKRITVEQMLESLSESNSIDEVLQAHPHLTKNQVHAALSFAAQSIRGDEIYPLAK